jgi:hypothetical protein
MEKLLAKEQVYIHKYVMRRMENNPLDTFHHAYVVNEYHLADPKLSVAPLQSF